MKPPHQPISQAARKVGRRQKLRRRDPQSGRIAAPHISRALRQRRVEDAQTDDKFRLLVESSPDGIVVIDNRGMIAGWNQVQEQIYGLKKADVLGQPSWEVQAKTYPDISQAPTYQQIMKEGVMALLKTGQAPYLNQPFERIIQRPDGTRRIVELTAFIYKTAEGFIAVNITHDITERKQAEEELVRSHKLMSAISQAQSKAINQSDAHEIFDAMLGELLAITESEYGFMGEVRSSAEGQPYLKTYALTNIAWNEATQEFYQQHAPEGLEFFNLNTLFGAVMKTGQPVITNDPTHDPRRGGIPAGHPPLRAFLGLPFYSGSHIVGMLGIANRPGGYDEGLIAFLTPLLVTCANLIDSFRNQEQRQRAEAALRESEGRFRAIFEQAAVGVAQVIPRSGKFVRINQKYCDIVGYTHDEMLQQTFQAISHPDDLPQNLALMEQLLEGKIRTFSIEKRYLRKDGATVWVNLTVAPMWNPGEEPVYHVTVVEDITARKQMEEEIKHRLAELEAVNHISTALRGAHTLDEMLPCLLDETLSIIGTEAGIIWLYEAASGDLRRAVSRGWFTQLEEPVILPGEGIAGHVFQTSEAHLSPEFVHDPLTRKETLAQIPTGWGGACVPIHSEQEIIGVLFVSVKLPRQLGREEAHLLTTISEIAGSAIRRAWLYQHSEHQVQRLDALRAIDLAISSVLDLRITLNILLDHILAQLKVDAASVLLLNLQSHRLEFSVGRGFRQTAITRSSQPLGDGPAGRAALERVLVHIPNLEKEETERCRLLSRDGFVAYYALPLVAKGQIKGVLEICHRGPLEPDADWLNFLDMLAGQAAIAIDNTNLFESLQRSNTNLAVAYDATIEGWSRALDLRDKETEGHTLRVAEITSELAVSLGLNREDMSHIRRGALLHDIGKMGVPDNILNKTTDLTPAEWEIMVKHPQFAYDMLAPITFLQPAIDIPYCHHEKWDGSGYPRGLRGEQIPLVARIFAVVDVYDALTSDRPYRKAWPKEKAIQYIRAQAGQHFDPRMVEALLHMIAM